MSNQLNLLLEQLHSLTESLKQQVVDHEHEANDTTGNWILLLNERQKIIDLLTLNVGKSANFPDDQGKDYFEKVRLLDQQILPIIRAKMAEIQSQLLSIKKSKLANQQYNGGYGYTPYGAFFDKKK